MEGFRARQKHYLSLSIIVTTYWTFKYQALCVVCYVHFIFVFQDLFIEGGEGAEGENPQADSELSAEPDAGLDLMTPRP